MLLVRDLDRGSLHEGSSEGTEEEGQHLKGEQQWLEKPWSKLGRGGLTGGGLRGGGGGRRGVACEVAGGHALISKQLFEGQNRFSNFVC
jgi:hypothetical protein